MSGHTLPILFVNLGGEMLYVLTQRLTAQCVAQDKAHKVVCDIVNTMYGMKFMNEITRPQDLFARHNLRLIFEKLVHTSIMRLNSVSMDKLFDLMTMAVKYQILFCNKPKDLLLVTYNHLDTIAKMIPDQQVQTKALVENVYKTIDKIFGGMTAGQFQRLRAMLLNFFQDIHVRVSVFLRDKLQTQTGRFIIGPNRTLASGVDTPGSIRIYKKDGSWARTKAFKPGVSCVKLSKEPAYGIYGDRVITLGLNLYADDNGKSHGVSVDNRPQKEEFDTQLRRLMYWSTDAGSLGVKKTSNPTVTSSELEKMAVDASAAKELDILNSLLGHLSAGSGKGGGGNNVTFQLDLFGKESSNSGNNNDAPLPSASDLNAASTSTQHCAQRLQVKKVNNSQLDSIAAEMTVADDGSRGQSKGDDLLDLLDRA